MPQINLLPPELRTRQRDRRVFAGMIAAGAVIVLFLLVIVVFQRATISREEQDLAEREARAAQLRAEVADLREFDELAARVDQIRQTLATTFLNDVAWSRFLNDLSLVMPDNSWLVNLALTASVGQAPDGQGSFGTTTFQGFVFDFPGLAGWLTRVEGGIEGLTFVYLTTGTRQELFDRDVVSFGANANVTEPLLSRRCQEDRPCP